MTTTVHTPTCPSWCTSDALHDLDWDHPDVAADLHVGEVYRHGEGTIRVWSVDPWDTARRKEAGVWIELTQDAVYTTAELREMARRLADAADLVDSLLGGAA